VSKFTNAAALEDFATHDVGAKPDSYWAARWGWSPSQVARLRLGGRWDSDLPKMYSRHLSRLR